MAQLWTNTGKTRLASREAEEVTQLSIGRGDTTPEVTDTDLVEEILTLAASSLVQSEPGLVRHTATLLVSQANGETIEELGLRNADGDLLARFVVPPLEKTTDFEFQFRVRSRRRNEGE
jgi:alpha-D-ribose 1-methylphosphonate 5-triphosphate synthase subunit PhnI